MRKGCPMAVVVLTSRAGIPSVPSRLTGRRVPACAGGSCGTGACRDRRADSRTRGSTNMRLNRLEIAGFKSFADRSELAFDTGVTAIVGPNGCGKSNVVDAITWVLGEQSAKSLRGDQMQDVIFQGSDARKPTSAAEVRLRLSGVASRVPGNGTVAASRERPMFAPAAVPASQVETLVAGAVLEQAMPIAR